MMEYKEIEDSVEVPKNTGTDGFLRTIEYVLNLSRVQSVSIDAKGTVSWRRFVTDEEPPVVGLEFGDLEPWGIIRNGEVVELPLLSTNAAITLSMMLDRASAERLFPVGFVTGAETVLWDWFSESTGYAPLSRDAITGLPVYLDRHAPDTALILCAAYAKDGALVDTQKSYKVEMDHTIAPGTYVEVFDNG